MGGKGVPRGHSQPGTSSGKKKPKSSKLKGNLDDVVLIDVDSDPSSNVIIIDAPESLQQRLRASSVRSKKIRVPPEGVISIDDDESDIMDHPGISDKDGGDLDSDATSSKRCCSSSKNMQNAVDSDGDECRVVEKRSPFKLSKCKQSYSEKATGRNRYGLDPGSENDSSDSELMEGSYGKLHEQWEKASLKRKHDLRNSQSSPDDQTSISGSHAYSQPNVEMEDRTEKHPDAPFCSSSSTEDCEKDNIPSFFASSFFASTDRCRWGTSISRDKESPFLNLNQRDHQMFAEDPSLSHGRQSCSHVSGGGNGFCHEQFFQRHPFSSVQEQGGRKSKHVKSNQGEIHSDLDRVVSGNKGDDCPQAPSSCNSFDEINVKYGRVVSNEAVNGFCNGFFNDEEQSPLSSLWSNQDQGGKRRKYDSSNEEDGEIHANVDGGGIFRNKDDGLQRATSCSSFKKKDGVVPNSRSSSETQVDYGVPCTESKERSIPGQFFGVHLEGKSGASNKEAPFKEKVKEDSGQIPLNDNENTETHMVEAEEAYHVRDPLLAEDGNIIPSCQTDIINEREKMKETDEYKRAIEEEWASRQRQLRLQAEEAQRLRKIKRAERRLLDMQIRQKQRVEEVRESQKKDEQNMNLKEQLRVEIRKELNKLEIMCIDMASLLRGLGIQVGGGSYPLSHEVKAAYKRALLKFHPDRASKTDIRQQVEAEEKFKLISRMKEKFFGALCY